MFTPRSRRSSGVRTVLFFFLSLFFPQSQTSPHIWQIEWGGRETSGRSASHIRRRPLIHSFLPFSFLSRTVVLLPDVSARHGLGLGFRRLKQRMQESETLAEEEAEGFLPLVFFAFLRSGCSRFARCDLQKIRFKVFLLMIRSTLCSVLQEVLFLETYLA